MLWDLTTKLLMRYLYVPLESFKYLTTCTLYISLLVPPKGCLFYRLRVTVAGHRHYSLLICHIGIPIEGGMMQPILTLESAALLKSRSIVTYAMCGLKGSKVWSTYGSVACTVSFIPYPLLAHMQGTMWIVLCILYIKPRYRSIFAAHYMWI